MITAERMAVVDRNATALGVSQKQLMESSGNAIAREVRDIAAGTDDAAAEHEIAVVTGRGNNGGDAFVAARFLEAYDVTVYLLGRAETITTEIARENWRALQRGEYDAREVRDSADLDLGDPDVVVDAMLGTGITGALREPVATAASRITATDATVLSVDVPSGVNADTGEPAAGAVEADRVVTFHDVKPGLADLDAEVTVADIGIPEAAELFVERGDLQLLTRDPDAHKGDFGDVLVIGGGPYTGAPALSASAILRAGADLAFVLAPDTVSRDIQGFSENLIVREYPGERFSPEHVETALAEGADHDAVVFGPGLGDHDETLRAAREFLSAYDGRAVVDADALQVVPDVDTGATLVCTPHRGELRAMGGETADDWRTRADLVESFAAEVGHTLLVKGPYDVISDGETTRVGRTGNPGMTVGGTGDVLAGVTGALLTQQEPVDAAAIAAYVNGGAGDRVVDDRGYGLVATDLLDAIPRVMWGDRNG